MDLKIIGELIKMVSESKLTALEVQEKELRIKLEKGNSVFVSDEIGVDKSSSIQSINFDKTKSNVDLGSVSFAPEVRQDEKELDVESVDEVDYKIMKSPIVGTFYIAASPDSEPFISKGKKVKKGDIICIIEAMKLMNEIESEFDGEVVDILVENGSVVEYGQPLLKLK